MIESGHSKSLWVDKTLESMSLRKKIGQMLIPFIPPDTALDDIADLIDECKVGGLRISGKGLQDQREKIVRRSPEVIDYLEKAILDKRLEAGIAKELTGRHLGV